MNKINLIFSWKFKLKFGNKIWSQGEIGDFWNLEFFKAKEISGKNPKWQEDSKHAQKKNTKENTIFAKIKKTGKMRVCTPPCLENYLINLNLSQEGDIFWNFIKRQELCGAKFWNWNLLRLWSNLRECNFVLAACRMIFTFPFSNGK